MSNTSEMNLKVNDTEYSIIQTNIKKYSENIENVMAQFEYCLDYFTTYNGYTDGVVEERIQVVKNKITTIRNTLEETSESVANTCKEYVDTIDEKDKYLY